jgi:hypothetical protein
MLLVLARGLFVACALSGFGAALFALTVPITGHVNARGRSSIERQVRKVISLSLAAALVFGYAWLLLETHALAGTTDLAQTITAIPAVLFDTRFGQVLALQTVAIAGALIAAWRRRGILAAALAGTAVMLEAGHSHAFAMAHIPLLLSQMLDLDCRHQSLSFDAGGGRARWREGKEGSRAQHWDRNWCRSLRGVCREPA